MSGSVTAEEILSKDSKTSIRSQQSSDSNYSVEQSVAEKLSVYSDIHSSVKFKQDEKLSEEILNSDDITESGDATDYVFSDSTSTAASYLDNNLETSNSRAVEKVPSDNISSAFERPRRQLKKTMRYMIDADQNIEDTNTAPLHKKPKVTHSFKEVKASKDNSSTTIQNVPESDSRRNSQARKAVTRKNGGKSIRPILPASALEKETRLANLQEEERLVRLNKRSKDGMTDFYSQEGGKVVVYTRFCLEKGRDGEDRVSMSRNVVRHLKPHQVEGVQFLWDNTVESVDCARNSKGSGAILAHCMGLGKSLQVVSFLHTVLNCKQLPFRTALIIVPTNTILNWVAECDIWFTQDEKLQVYEISMQKSEKSRSRALIKWFKSGGIMIVGYQMFRSCVISRKPMERKVKDRLKATLINPGPDFVICDEGHLLKNDETAVSKAVSKVSTLRRIVLTGTPLQNNLMEYHCMVNFVKPNLLGTKTEFRNQFVNPIGNGQRKDASALDVRVMKHRSHVLHELLSGCVQRKDYSYITKFLPPKYEYVLSIRLTDRQIQLYRTYLDLFSSKTEDESQKDNLRRCLFRDYQMLAKIWTHPACLKYATPADDLLVETNKSKKEKEKTNSKKKLTKNDSIAIEVPDKGLSCNDESFWYSDILENDDETKLHLSGKLVLLCDVLKGANLLQEKVLVFSQSLASLTLIEDILSLITQTKLQKRPKDGRQFERTSRQGITGSETGSGLWIPDKDYLRLDGSSSAQRRKEMCDRFNSDDRRCRLFLISTRAGSLGINLVAANRVILFDASWNPSHDVQSMFRCYRFGQRKPVYVYRFIAQGTMEEKIYNRQVTKESLSLRVIDENQIDRHFNREELDYLYKFEPVPYNRQKRTENPVCKIPDDEVLAELLMSRKDFLYKYHEHDSLLEHKEDENLNEDDKRAAWKEYEKERRGIQFLARRQTKESRSIPKGGDEKGSKELESDSDSMYANVKVDTVFQEMIEWGASFDFEGASQASVRASLISYIKTLKKINPTADEKFTVKSLYEGFPDFYLQSLGFRNPVFENEMSEPSKIKDFVPSSGLRDSAEKRKMRGQRKRNINKTKRPKLLKRSRTLLATSSDSGQKSSSVLSVQSRNNRLSIKSLVNDLPSDTSGSSHSVEVVNEEQFGEPFNETDSSVVRLSHL